MKVNRLTTVLALAALALCLGGCNTNWPGDDVVNPPSGSDCNGGQQDISGGVDDNSGITEPPCDDVATGHDNGGGPCCDNLDITTGHDNGTTGQDVNVTPKTGYDMSFLIDADVADVAFLRNGKNEVEIYHLYKNTEFVLHVDQKDEPAILGIIHQCWGTSPCPDPKVPRPTLTFKTTPEKNWFWYFGWTHGYTLNCDWITNDLVYLYGANLYSWFDLDFVASSKLLP